MSRAWSVTRIVRTSGAGHRMGRFRAAMLGITVAVVAVASVVPASGSDGRQVTVTPGRGLVDGQYVAVTFSGFPAGEDVRARLCPRSAKKVSRCKRDSTSLNESGDQRLTRVSDTGTGDMTFIVAAGKLTDQGGRKFKCDFLTRCNVVVFELDQSTLVEEGFGAAAKAPVPFARSTVACPQPRGAKRVAGSGATSTTAAMVEWQAETCGNPHNLQVSYSSTNSPNGKQAFLDGLSDSEFAVSTIPLKDHEEQTLQAAGRQAVHIPVAVGSLSIAYNYWDDLNRCDSDPVKERITSLQLSPSTLAMVITGRIGNLADPAIAADNPHLVERVRIKVDGECQTSDHLPSRLVKPVARADNSGATWALTSFMLAAAPDAWRSAGPEFQEPTEIFPSYNAVDLRTGSAAVGRQIRTFSGGQGVGEIPDALWIGFVDTSVAGQLGLPSAAIRNAAGAYVAPTEESVGAALAAGTLNDGVVTPNYAATDAGAYPLPLISYLITDTNRMSGAQANVFKAFATYAITTGQKDATKRGYIPLTDELKTAAAASIGSIKGATTSGTSGGGGTGNSSGADPGNSDEAQAFDADGDGDVEAVDEVLASAGAAGGASSGGSAVAGGGGSSDPGPIEGALAASKLGPAGGPAGVVRALTVFLGLPLLLTLGIASIVGGRLLVGVSNRPAGAEVRPFPTLRQRFQVGSWRRAI